jgi:hypothetical protein
MSTSCSAEQLGLVNVKVIARAAEERDEKVQKEREEGGLRISKWSGNSERPGASEAGVHVGPQPDVEGRSDGAGQQDLKIVAFFVRTSSPPASGPESTWKRAWPA